MRLNLAGDFRSGFWILGCFIRQTKKNGQIGRVLQICPQRMQLGGALKWVNVATGNGAK